MEVSHIMAELVESSIMNPMVIDPSSRIGNLIHA